MVKSISVKLVVIYSVRCVRITADCHKQRRLSAERALKQLATETIFNEISYLAKRSIFG